MRAVSIEDDDEAVQVVSELRRFDEPSLRLYLVGQGIADAPEDIARNKQRLHIRRLVCTPDEGPPALPADLAWLWIVPVIVAAWMRWLPLRSRLARRASAREDVDGRGRE